MPAPELESYYQLEASGHRVLLVLIQMLRQEASGTPCLSWIRSSSHPLASCCCISGLDMQQVVAKDDSRALRCSAQLAKPVSLSLSLSLSLCDSVAPLPGRTLYVTVACSS